MELIQECNHLQCKLSPEGKKIDFFFNCTLGHLNCPSAPTKGHFSVCFDNIPMSTCEPRDEVRGEGVGRGNAGRALCNAEKD